MSVTVLLLVSTNMLAVTASKSPLLEYLSASLLTCMLHYRQSGHQAAECTEPRSAEGIECRKCNESKSSRTEHPSISVLTAYSGSLLQRLPNWWVECLPQLRRGGTYL